MLAQADRRRLYSGVYMAVMVPGIVGVRLHYNMG